MRTRIVSYTGLGLVAVALLVFTGTAHAATRDWDGGSFFTGQDWFDPANWNPDGAPVSNDDLTISGSGVQINAAADVTTDANGSISLNGRDTFLNNVFVGTTANGPGTLTINGGSLSANDLLIDGVGSSFNFIDGQNPSTFALSSLANLTVSNGAATQIGNSSIFSSPNLRVSNATTVNSGASLTIDSGTLTTDTLAADGTNTQFTLNNNGSLNGVISDPVTFQTRLASITASNGAAMEFGAAGQQFFGFTNSQSVSIESGASFTIRNGDLTTDTLILDGPNTQFTAANSSIRSNNFFGPGTGTGLNIAVSNGASLTLDNTGSGFFSSLDFDTATFGTNTSLTINEAQAFGTSMTFDNANANIMLMGTANSFFGGISVQDLTASNTTSVSITGNQFSFVAIFGTLTIESGSSVTIDVPGTTLGNIVLDGGTLIVPNGFILNDDTAANISLSGNGTVQGPVFGGPLATIQTTGTLDMGDPNSFLGFNFLGTLGVGAATVTLHSAGFANLGALTTINGGTLNAANGIALGTGDNLVAGSTVNAKIAAAFGSAIRATGNLTLGDANSLVGFASDGELYVGANTVTINDRNEAVLGTLTELGDAATPASPGTLTAANGFLLEQGKNLVGYGTVNGDFINQGFVEAIGPDPSDEIIFNGTLTGIGSFAGTIMINSIFAPGNSPGKIEVTGDVTLGDSAVLQMELGGRTLGSDYDHLDITGQLAVDGTLELLLIDGFTPGMGDTFDLLDFASVTGTFDQIDLPTLGNGFFFNTSSLLTTGTISVVPEPSTAGLLLLLTAATLYKRRRNCPRVITPFLI